MSLAAIRQGLLVLSAVLVGLVSAPSGAIAADTPTDQGAPEKATDMGASDKPKDQGATNQGTDQSPQVEEIVVNARRREESLQTVPIAITVVPQETLRANNVQTVGDLQYLVPSMSTTTGVTRDAVNVSIRGQGTNSVSGLPGVVSYLNEVPIPTDRDGNTAGGPGLLFDLENVQALKGPQGTLFGRNSVGGALLLQTARPTHDFGGRVQLSYGNYSDKEVDAAINVPISDSLLTRVAINGQARDGFTHLLGDPNYPSGTDADNRNYYATRGTVTFHPNDTFENDTILSYSNYKSHGSPLILTDFNPAGLAAKVFPKLASLFQEQQALGIRTALPVDTNLVSSGNLLAVSNITRLDIADEITFRNIFGYNNSKQILSVEADGTNLPILDLVTNPRNWTFRQISEEPQLLGKGLGGQLDWIVGAFYLNQPTTPYVLQASTIFGQRSGGYNQFGDKSRALYGQGTYALSSIVPELAVTAGVRYTKDDRLSGESPCGVPPQCASATLSEGTSDSAVTWTAGLDYHLARYTHLFLTASRGYRAGGNNVATAAVPTPFAPEHVNNYELGVKSDWVVGNVPIRTNAAIYYQDYQDIQVQETHLNPSTNTFNIITANAAAAKIYGTEFEVQLKPTKDLELGAHFDSIKFEYSSFGPGVDRGSLIGGESGNAIPYKYGLDARYHVPVDQRIGEISLRGAWNWQASSGDSSQPGGVIGSFGLLNLSADWDRVRGSSLDVSLFASNVFNKDYSTGTVPLYNNLGFSLQRFGEPRMYGIRLRYRVGHI